jgi:hypothetical protein
MEARVVKIKHSVKKGVSMPNTNKVDAFITWQEEFKALWLPQILNGKGLDD